ncbi:MAG: hypothetical protein JWQ84_3291 [Mucilaginibacter sp.]|jgi:hypothetical protein|nr:hypothetical protein [Mucilaginibacter sp.]
MYFINKNLLLASFVHRLLFLIKCTHSQILLNIINAALQRGEPEHLLPGACVCPRLTVTIFS